MSPSREDITIISPVILNLVVALGIGLLIGAERERRKGEGPARSPAGIRTFTVASLTGAISPAGLQPSSRSAARATQDDSIPDVPSPTMDAEAAAAVETIPDAAISSNLPVIQKADLPLSWQGKSPVLCLSGRTPLDEAAAVLFAQLSNAHGLAARVEPADALSTTNISQLETSGVAIVCLSYLDASSPAHMRYSVRRLRRKLPKATIMRGCWAEGLGKEALEELREAASADTAAGSLREAMMICRTAASVQEIDEQPSLVTTALRIA